MRCLSGEEAFVGAVHDCIAAVAERGLVVAE
jgi:hypothetical protein